VAKQQRGFERHDLPEPCDRLRIQLAAIQRLLHAGYLHVGMDHFAREGDELARAPRERTLRRNFMGYTTRAGVDLLGVGPSAISELGASYAQSRRELASWQVEARAGRLATERGHALSADDLERRWVIGQIMCQGEVLAADWHARFGGSFARRFAAELASLEGMAADGLLAVDSDGSLRVSPLGRLVVRNVAMAFDAYLPAQQRGARPLFSQTL
jgi:oxygen-independent coproporphyrinogen-3 oxidase